MITRVPMGYGYSSRYTKSKIKFMVIIGVLVLTTVTPCTYQTTTVDSVDSVKVEEKEAAPTHGGGKYLVFAKSGTVYENSDALFHWKFNSSDLYNDIEVGECYDFKIYGWRVHFLSMYKNILKLKEVDCK